MEKDLFGTTKVAVVRDELECSQARMHLDCVFNIVGDDCCLLAEDVIGEDSPLRRVVDEYERTDGDPGPLGRPSVWADCAAELRRAGSGSAAPAPGPLYQLKRRGVEFSRYLKDEGYNIIPISREHQLQYACNGLNLGDSNILMCHAATARQIVRSPHFHGNVQLVEFNAISSMFGALHCSSQARRSRRWPAAVAARLGFGGTFRSLEAPMEMNLEPCIIPEAGSAPRSLLARPRRVQHRAQPAAQRQPAQPACCQYTIANRARRRDRRPQRRRPAHHEPLAVRRTSARRPFQCAFGQRAAAGR